MSLARDDINSLRALDALESTFIKTAALEEKEKISETSGKQQSEPEINDVYEKGSSSNSPKETEKIQENYTALEIKNQKLDEINTDLKKIDQTYNTPEKSEKQGEILGKIESLMTKIEEKQQEISGLQEEIKTQVDSLVELDVQGNNTETTTGDAPQNVEDLKKDIIDEIKTKPEETLRKIEIKHLDRDLLLAMISI